MVQAESRLWSGLCLDYIDMRFDVDAMGNIVGLAPMLRIFETTRWLVISNSKSHWGKYWHESHLLSSEAWCYGG